MLPGEGEAVQLSRGGDEHLGATAPISFPPVHSCSQYLGNSCLCPTLQPSRSCVHSHSPSPSEHCLPTLEFSHLSSSQCCPVQVSRAQAPSSSPSCPRCRLQDVASCPDRLWSLLLTDLPHAGESLLLAGREGAVCPVWAHSAPVGLADWGPGAVGPNAAPSPARGR